MTAVYPRQTVSWFGDGREGAVVDAETFAIPALPLYPQLIVAPADQCVEIAIVETEPGVWVAGWKVGLP